MIKSILLSMIVVIASQCGASSEIKKELAIGGAYFALDAAGSALSLKALSAKTPGAFRRYKAAALVLEVVSTVPFFTLDIAQAMRTGKLNVVHTLFGVLVGYYMLLRVKRLARQAKNADQLHLLLANPTTKGQLGVKNMSAAVRKQLLVDFAVLGAHVAAAYGTHKSQQFTRNGESSLVLNFIVGALAAEATSIALKNERLGENTDALFHAALESNEQFLKAYNDTQDDREL